MSALAEPREVRMQWRGKQSEALLDPTRYLDIEGAIRSSKTTIGLWKVINACLEHPGMRWLVCRWTDDAVNSTVKPLLMLILRQIRAAFTWHPDEHRLELPNGSWIYIRGLRASEDTNRFGKFRGLTLSGVLLDQAEEAPEDIYLELKGRLSQPGYPHQMILTPNPPGEDHWLAKEFPEDNSREAHKLIRLALYDNAHNLDAGYIAQLERDYPPGHPMRRRLIEGRRGLNVRGKPVYAGYFDRDRQVQPLLLNPSVPLLVSIDFGHHHPCALFHQFLPWGALHWLGGVMGEDLFIEDFAPIIGQYRAQWFPSAHDVWVCCDPAGSHQNSQGTKKNGVTVLRENGLSPRWIDSSNQPEVRVYAIETLAGYMRRDRFRIDPKRWAIVGTTDAKCPSSFAIDGLDAGYVWDERTRRTAGGKNLQLPLKDGFYEHAMNAGEYGVINFGPAQPAKVDERKLEAQALRAAQRDKDPYDQHRARAFAGRGGY